MSAVTTTITQHMLGFEPYVLLRAVLDEDGEVSIKLEAGGGVRTQQDIADVLAGALVELLDDGPTKDALDEFLAVEADVDMETDVEDNECDHA